MLFSVVFVVLGFEQRSPLLATGQCPHWLERQDRDAAAPRCEVGVNAVAPSALSCPRRKSVSGSVDLRRCSAWHLEQPGESGDIEQPLHHWTGMTEHENALFVSKLSFKRLSFKSKDRCEPTSVDKRKLGEVDGYDTLLCSTEPD
jgi:hypothetical protein